MNLQITYFIELLNGNQITGDINCRPGEDIAALKKKIFDF